ncbi:tripartite tricarboxylate transporter TctB family protein [Acidovorax sp. DW039]|uniref:tripartite tricarboxylate transporter TctB family protein n=1 Tax=Acidovorax sp. DW039 TaxID=3095606 RepID=UPI00308D2D09|nr:tripartite tricarboxylate transporter TctB family protein [Acidovorax sp. DW039]
MKIKSQKDFFSGVMFMAVGGAFAWGATTYNIGSGARMGPGYFPLILGILLAIIGLVITFKAMTVETADGDKIGKWAWKPLFFILAANFAFGILLGGLPSIGVPAMGLIVAIYALTFIASLAGNEFSAKGVFGLATILAIGSYVAFVWALKLQFPVWPSFISG